MTPPTIKIIRGASLLACCLVLAAGAEAQTDRGEPATQSGEAKPSREQRLALYQALRKDLPALQPVHQAVAAANMDEARHQLAAYFGKRGKPVFVPAPDSMLEASRTYADLALQGKMYAPSTGIEPWPAKPGEMWSDTPKGQDQWAVSLNRHLHWIWLAKAYRESRDRRYLELLEAQILDWSATMPVRIGPRFIEGLVDEPGRISLTLNAGQRMSRSWFYVFDTLKGELSDVVIETMLFWMREHGNYLLAEQHFDARTNWGAMQTTGLFAYK